MEINADHTRNYTFRWDGDEEVFDTSLNAFLSASDTNFPGLPDLKEIGFKTASGKVFKYEGVAPDVFIKNFNENHPEEKCVALIFQGYLDQDLEIKLEGRTPVCRVDIIGNSKNTTLWRNMSGQSNANLKSEPTQ